MDEWEMDGAHAEIERLAALHQSKKPMYSDRFLSKRTPGTEHLGAPADAQLSHEEVLGAVAELAGLHQVSTARVRGMVMLAAAAAGLGHSPEEEAACVAEVALSLEQGRLNVSDEQILKLSHRWDGDEIGLDAVEEQREAVRAGAMVLGLTVTAEQRAKFAKSGIALDDGAFPVHDADHLAAAKAEYRKGNLAGHSKAEVRAHINKNARRLGLSGLDDGDGDGVAATVALSQETQAMALAAGSGADSPEAVISRHPELSHLFRAGKTSARKHPSRAGREVTTRTRAHSSDTGDQDPSDTDQPGRGGQVHGEVARYLKMREDMFGGEARHADSHGRNSYPPK